MEELGRDWMDINQTEFKTIDWEIVEYIHLAQNRDQWRDLVRDSKELLDYIK